MIGNHIKIGKKVFIGIKEIAEFFRNSNFIKIFPSHSYGLMPIIRPFTRTPGGSFFIQSATTNLFMVLAKSLFTMISPEI